MCVIGLLQEENSTRCNGTGTYTCGICECPSDRYGKECECDKADINDEDLEAQCKQ